MLRTFIEELQFVSHWWHHVMLLWTTNSVDTQKLNNINTLFGLKNQSSPYFRQINEFKQKPEETVSPDYFLPIMRRVYGFLLIWDALYWRGLESLVTLHGNFTAAQSINILGIIYILLCKLYFQENAHFIMIPSILLKLSKNAFKSMRNKWDILLVPLSFLTWAIMSICGYIWSQNSVVDFLHRLRFWN